jgi:hypothetical protein
MPVIGTPRQAVVPRTKGAKMAESSLTDRPTRSLGAQGVAERRKLWER